MTIYLVHGSAGEYSDKYEWIYRAFYDPDKAELCCKELQIICETAEKDFEEMYDKSTSAEEYLEYDRKINEFKEKYRYIPGPYSDGVFFHVVPVELVD